MILHKISINASFSKRYIKIYTLFGWDSETLAIKIYLCLNQFTAEVIPLYNGSDRLTSGG